MRIYTNRLNTSRRPLGENFNTVDSLPLSVFRKLNVSLGGVLAGLTHNNTFQYLKIPRLWIKTAGLLSTG